MVTPSEEVSGGILKGELNLHHKEHGWLVPASAQVSDSCVRVAIPTDIAEISLIPRKPLCLAFTESEFVVSSKADTSSQDVSITHNRGSHLQNQLGGTLAATSLLLVLSAQPHSQRCNARDSRSYGWRGCLDAGWLHPWAASVQNVSLKWDQVVVCQIGDISCWIITVFQLWGKVTNTFKPKKRWKKKNKHQKALSHLENQRNWGKITKGVGEALGADFIHTFFISYTHVFMTEPWASENHGECTQLILSPLTFKASSEEGRKNAGSESCKSESRSWSPHLSILFPQHVSTTHDTSIVT